MTPPDTSMSPPGRRPAHLRTARQTARPSGLGRPTGSIGSNPAKIARSRPQPKPNVAPQRPDKPAEFGASSRPPDDRRRTALGPRHEPDEDRPPDPPTDNKPGL